jgi:uncharacterized protein
MSENLKIPSPWAQLALFLLLFGGAFCVIAIVDVLVSLSPIDLHAAGTIKFLQALNSALFFGIPPFFYARLVFIDRPLYQLGFQPAIRTPFYLLGILLLLFAIPLEGWLGILNRRLPLAEWMIRLEKQNDNEVVVLLKAKSGLDVIINVLVMAVIPAIFEEMCFRGALQRILIRLFKNPWMGIIATAILFSAFHLQFEGFLPRMFLGILLGATFWYSGSLWTNILAHCFYNGIQVVAASYYPQAFNDNNPSVPMYSVVISALFVLGLLATMSEIRRQGAASGSGQNKLNS